MDNFNLSRTHVNKWDDVELRRLVKAGTFVKCQSSREHVALHPFWLSSPLQGIEEEFGHQLGHWMKRLGGYLVAYKNLRRDPKSPAMLNVDQPWVHVDVKGKFYVYKPEIGQILRGVVKKVGDTAAICVAFNYFSVTVHPKHRWELENWIVDETELEFRVTYVRNRRKGPLLKATCI